MSYLTYLLPLAAAAFVIWCAWQWLPVFSEQLPEPPAEGDSPARGAKSRPSASPPSAAALTRRDGLAVLVICAVYAVTAFVGLGDTTAPQSRCEFAERGSNVVIELPESTQIGKLRWFSGLYTGEYYLAVSEDGEDWTPVGEIEQGYADLFKWLDYPATRTPRSRLSVSRASTCA